MSDNGEIKKEEVRQESKSIQLIINFYSDGKIDLQGPITDRVLCYGLLEVAKEIIHDLKNAPKIELPNSHKIFDFIRNRK